MPPVSQKQRNWAWAEKDTNPAAAEFAASDKGGKLPARAKKTRKKAPQKDGLAKYAKSVRFIGG